MTVWAGKPFGLEPWQKRFWRERSPSTPYSPHPALAMVASVRDADAERPFGGLTPSEAAQRRWSLERCRCQRAGPTPERSESQQARFPARTGQHEHNQPTVPSVTFRASERHIGPRSERFTKQG